MVKDYSVISSSGRILEVSEGGDPNGFPIFSLHGTPGSRILFSQHITDAKKQHIRLIGISRPGYGGSTPNPGRRIVDNAYDVEAVADNLGLDRFAVYGYSGGGSPALACASVLPQRVVAASSIAGVAPFDTEELDWFSGMGEFNVDDFKLMLRDQNKWERKNLEDAEVFVNGSRNDLMEMMNTLLCDVDRRSLTDDVATFLHRQFQEGYRKGIRGICDDSLSQCKSWGFDPTSINIPIQIWHGWYDKFVPFLHGEWLSSRIPNAEAHLEREEGHTSLIINKVPEVHSWLASKF